MLRLLMLLYLLVLLAIGTGCVFFPQRVQLIAAHLVEIRPRASVRLPEEAAEAQRHLRTLRAIGIGAYAIFVYLLFALLLRR
jgi:hypothetical protein